MAPWMDPYLYDLVQQLFRQKIGQEMDPNLFYEILYPMLRERKHLPRELLLDIKLTQCSNENGKSVIKHPGPGRGPYPNLVVAQRIPHACISPFTPKLARPALQPRMHWSSDQLSIPLRRTSGRITSKFRRKMMWYWSWGTVDIINELRELNHPKIRYYSLPDMNDNIPWPASQAEGRRCGICLEETKWVPGATDFEERMYRRDTDRKLVNDILENSLHDDNGLSWSWGHSPFARHGRGMLSTPLST